LGVEDRRWHRLPACDLRKSQPGWMCHFEDAGQRQTVFPHCAGALCGRRTPSCHIRCCTGGLRSETFCFLAAGLSGSFPCEKSGAMTPKAVFSHAVGKPHRIDPRAAIRPPNAKLRGLYGWVKLPAALSAVLLGCLSSGCVGNAGSPIVYGVKPEKVAKARYAGEGPAWNAREGTLY
jgi:hypothetical protein